MGKVPEFYGCVVCIQQGNRIKHPARKMWVKGNQAYCIIHKPDDAEKMI